MADEPKYKNVKQIAKIHEEKVTNEYLRNGWYLRDTYKTWDGPQDLHENIVFVLAWEDGDPPHLPVGVSLGARFR